MGRMKDVLATVRAWDAAGLASAEAILVGTQHSSPRQPGARLVVNAEIDKRQIGHPLALLMGQPVASAGRGRSARPWLFVDRAPPRRATSIWRGPPT